MLTPAREPMVTSDPVARTVAQAQSRSRVQLAGRILSVRGHRKPWWRFDAVISDGTGELTVRFLGRDDVPGIVPGALLRVQGTVCLERGARVVLNPVYELC